MELDHLKNENSDGMETPTQNSLRVRTPLRMHYDAQVAVIQKQLEGLEEVRMKLNLSQRKISQLLLVDPSAWTRWTKKGHPAPGIIWRALQWYLIIQEKIPGLTANYFLHQAGSSAGLSSEVVKELQRELKAKQKLSETQLSESFANSIGEIQRELDQFKEANQKLTNHLLELETKLKYWRVGTIILTLTIIFAAYVYTLWAKRIS